MLLIPMPGSASLFAQLLESLRPRLQRFTPATAEDSQRPLLTGLQEDLPAVLGAWKAHKPVPLVADELYNLIASRREDEFDDRADDDLALQGQPRLSQVPRYHLGGLDHEQQRRALQTSLSAPALHDALLMLAARTARRLHEPRAAQLFLSCGWVHREAAEAPGRSPPPSPLLLLPARLGREQPRGRFHLYPEPGPWMFNPWLARWLREHDQQPLARQPLHPRLTWDELLRPLHEALALHLDTRAEPGFGLQLLPLVDYVLDAASLAFAAHPPDAFPWTRFSPRGERPGPPPDAAPATSLLGLTPPEASLAHALSAPGAHRLTAPPAARGLSVALEALLQRLPAGETALIVLPNAAFHAAVRRLLKRLQLDRFTLDVPPDGISPQRCAQLLRERAATIPDPGHEEPAAPTASPPAHDIRGRGRALEQDRLQAAAHLLRQLSRRAHESARGPGDPAWRSVTPLVMGEASGLLRLLAAHDWSFDRVVVVAAEAWPWPQLLPLLGRADHWIALGDELAPALDHETALATRLGASLLAAATHARWQAHRLPFSADTRTQRLLAFPRHLEDDGALHTIDDPDAETRLDPIRTYHPGAAEPVDDHQLVLDCGRHLVRLIRQRQNPALRVVLWSEEDLGRLVRRLEYADRVPVEHEPWDFLQAIQTGRLDLLPPSQLPLTPTPQTLTYLPNDPAILATARAEAGPWNRRWRRLLLATTERLTLIARESDTFSLFRAADPSPATALWHFLAQDHTPGERPAVPVDSRHDRLVATLRDDGYRLEAVGWGRPSATFLLLWSRRHPQQIPGIVALAPLAEALDRQPQGPDAVHTWRLLRQRGWRFYAWAEEDAGQSFPARYESLLAWLEGASGPV